MVTLDEIQTKCGHLTERDDVEIVRLLNIGRTRSREKLIGIGSVLEALGMTDGSAFLAFIESTPSLKYVWKLVEQSNLNIASPLVSANLDGFVQATVLSLENANKLKALGFEADKVTHSEVEKALEGTTWPI